MTVRRLDPDNGDIVTSGTQFLSGVDEIAQTIRTRLKLFYGEYFRDITDGTPWFQSILGKNSSLSQADTLIKRRISQTDGVTGILSYNADYDIDTRVYSISVSVLTKYGLVELQYGEVVSNG